MSLRKPSTLAKWPFLLLLPFLFYLIQSSHPPPSTLQKLREEVNPSCPHTRPLTVFLHLHKTGGNTLKKALFAFAKRNNLTIHHTCHPAHPDSLLFRWYFNRSQHDTSCNLDELRSSPNLDFVIGHQYLGVHSLFPEREVRYFTMVREPLQRKVAHFIHFEKGSDAKLFSYLVQKNRNYMTKRLASNRVDNEIVADLQNKFIDLEAFASRAALRAAKRHLTERFFFVGLQERFEESVCVLSRILNTACGPDGRLAKKWKLDMKKVMRGSENIRGVTVDRLKHVPAQVKQAAKRAEAADLELYRFAKMLFERKLDNYPECRL